VRFVFRACVGAALAVTGVAALAQSSPEMVAARQSGAIGERYDGYLGYSAYPGERVSREVGAVNIKRRSLYTGLATRRSATVQEVGIAAGCELLAEVRAGEAYMLSDGVWRRRAAGQPAPVPSYCGH
jgi:uncharacterized protein YdbL (DUF1318 family)